MRDLRISEDVAILGISLYVLGFALGPLVFAPMGEMFGRIGGGLAHNLPTLLSCRLLTGIFGSSPLTNAGGTVSDIWNARERGLASAIYATVPFLGPVIGPIVGGFVAENPHLGWHFNFWLIFLFSGITLVLGYFITPETVRLYASSNSMGRSSYGDVPRNFLLQSNGIVHFVSVHDLHRSRSFLQVMAVNLSRPFGLQYDSFYRYLSLSSFYSPYTFRSCTGPSTPLFSAFPIVFQQHRGFTQGQGGLAFLGVGFGIVMGTASQSYQNKLYRHSMDTSPTGRAPPEARLHTAIMGGVLIPIGLFLFACYSAPLCLKRLGDEWAMSVFALLALACTPIPILFWKYGRWIRSRSRVALKDFAATEATLSITPSSQLETIRETVQEKEGLEVGAAACDQYEKMTA
ncbi:major facilitator superfamily domain-containing protein [Lyophyllum atratum]|nr:major facilitator superfamily domain-containing protein [Lyophyllum atratum]